MKNKIYIINKTGAKQITDSCHDAYVAEIDGRSIQSEIDWLYTVAESFHFPVYDEIEHKMTFWYKGAYADRTSHKLNWEGFEDLLCDLSWIPHKRILFIIYNCSEMLTEDREAKEYIINALRERILPWWSSDVEKYVVNGEKREFSVYLAD
ncbi:MAG: hypothetical protein J6M17_02845 [Ruminococcus sp.]|nr:hypothetical protein [Ruminococcus sp.]